MRVNAFPFLFLPGLALIGYLLTGWLGVGWAVGVWLVPVVIGTLLELTRLSADMEAGLPAALADLFGH